MRERVVFTTHTPVPAGNETYRREEFLAAFGDLPGRLGIDEETVPRRSAASIPADTTERPGMTPLAIRVSSRRNGVSRLHGEVAREMWRPLFTASAADVPIGHVTNGAHLPTLPRRADGRNSSIGISATDWAVRAGDRATWEAVAEHSERRALGGALRGPAPSRRLHPRQDRAGPACSAASRSRTCGPSRQSLEADILTLGFARRLATYKRLHLLTYDADRVQRIFAGAHPVQLLIAGKAHPNDEDGKGHPPARLPASRREVGSEAERVVVVEDYDLRIGQQLVSGCDVWVNLPRRPLEASGTSGMKATFNGALQLSVLDGWWAEAYDGTNGWAIPGDEGDDETDAGRRSSTTCSRTR